MTIKERQLRASELADFIAFQEKSLDDGSKKLKELNNLYNMADREYKELLIKKRHLQDEVAALMQTADLYSNF